MHVTPWEVRRQPAGSVLPFSHVDPWHWTEDVRLGNKLPTAEPSCCPIFLHFQEILNDDYRIEDSKGTGPRKRLVDAGPTSDWTWQLLPREHGMLGGIIQTEDLGSQ